MAIFNFQKASLSPAPFARGYREENPLIRRILIALSLIFTLLILVMPLLVVISQAFGTGWDNFWKAVTNIFTLKALYLSLITTFSAVTANTVFGLAAAWALSRYNFKGQGFLITMIDLPFAISPIIAGLIFILTYGRLGWMNSFLQEHQIKIVFATPGLIMATIFVTIPFVARELIPVLVARGSDEEQAAVLMGAGFLTIFWRVTLPHIKWALIYSVILCAARAMGEFGAVSVVSGHLRGKTNTLPLHIEILYNEHHYNDAFAVSAILVITSVVILTARSVVEHISKREERSNVR
ncbi:MAG: sulfate ABC transporter permease subunit CysW [Deltaproteobacteria bacterium]|jgi:sulfate transport system permease protein|nr:sulfate ABC transporter permease subunit CysW [Deltaproteobacteria bacterium]